MPVRATRAGGAGSGTSGSRQPFGAAVWAVELGAAGLEGSRAVAQGSGGESEG